MKEQRLPFTIKPVTTTTALRKAVSIRQAAYARHMPSFAETLHSPEAGDFEDSSMVLLAESRLDGSPIGTIRVHTNRNMALPIEASVRLPDSMTSLHLSEATRLAVVEGRVGQVAKIALIKALYLYCLDREIFWVVVGARPPVDRQYRALLMDDIFPDQMFPLRHANSIPHRIMGMDIFNIRNRWTEAKHSLLTFMCDIHHPDIDLSDAYGKPWKLQLQNAENQSEFIRNSPDVTAIEFARKIR